MLTRSIADTTADNYERAWRQFERYCATARVSALPASPATVACYMGTLLRRGSVAHSSLQGYLTPINSRHAACGLPRPASGQLVSSLRVGYARISAEAVGTLPDTRRPLPAAVMWRIVELATATTDFGWRVRFTALVASFLVARRTCEVLALELGDVSVRPDGGVHIKVRFHKGAERRARLELLVFEIPPARDNRPDLPLLLLRRLLGDLAGQHAPPSRLLFAPPGMRRTPNANDVTAWLDEALLRLNIVPPPGVKYCSYSARGGGATAVHACGMSPPGVAQLLGHKGNDPRTALAHYIDLLAPRSDAAWRLCGRYVP